MVNSKTGYIKVRTRGYKQQLMIFYKRHRRKAILLTVGFSRAQIRLKMKNDEMKEERWWNVTQFWTKIAATVWPDSRVISHKIPNEKSSSNWITIYLKGKRTWPDNQISYVYEYPFLLLGICFSTIKDISPLVVYTDTPAVPNSKSFNVEISNLQDLEGIYYMI